MPLNFGVISFPNGGVKSRKKVNRAIIQLGKNTFSSTKYIIVSRGLQW